MDLRTGAGRGQRPHARRGKLIAGLVAFARGRFALSAPTGGPAASGKRATKAAHLRQAARSLGRDPDAFIREHFEKSGEAFAPFCPFELFRAWDVFVELAQWPGTGAEPISHAELAAWQANMDVRLTPLESMAIRRLDVEWRVAQHDRPRTP